MFLSMCFGGGEKKSKGNHEKSTRSSSIDSKESGGTRAAVSRATSSRIIKANSIRGSGHGDFSNSDDNDRPGGSRRAKKRPSLVSKVRTIIIPTIYSDINFP